MEKRKDEKFIYTTNDMKIGARVMVDGVPGIGIVRNGKVEGWLDGATLMQTLYDTKKPSFAFDNSSAR